MLAAYNNSEMFQVMLSMSQTGNPAATNFANKEAKKSEKKRVFLTETGAAAKNCYSD